MFRAVAALFTTLAQCSEQSQHYLPRYHNVQSSCSTIYHAITMFRAVAAVFNGCDYAIALCTMLSLLSTFAEQQSVIYLTPFINQSKRDAVNLLFSNARIH